VRSHPLMQLTLVKIRDLLREKEALFWVFVFPLLLAVALGIAFRGQEASPVPVGVVAGPGAEALAAALRGSDRLIVREFAGEDDAGDALRRGRVAIVVLPGDPPTYWYDPTRQESAYARLATDEAVQRGAGRVDPVRPEAREMTETGSRYIDFLLPGLIGMNLMGTGMWGVGYGIVEYRTKGILKRLAATPMRRGHFLLAQILGRLVFVIAEVAVLLGFGRLAFGVPMRGSYALFVAIAVLGGMAFAGIGLSTAARTKTVEGAAGLIQGLAADRPSGRPARRDAGRSGPRAGRGSAGDHRRVGGDGVRSRARGIPVAVIRVGLCERCCWARPVRSSRGSTFWRCSRADADSQYPRYPGLPVLRCAGFAAQPADREEEDRGDVR